jgi:GntR family transcriptional regulator/MocR family aminotransferase
LLAPTVSIGFIVAPPVVRDHLINLRSHCDRQGDAAVECAIAELFEDGELQRHVRRMRRTYAARRDAFARSLVRHLGASIEFEIPEGGLAIWASVDESIDVSRWRDACEREGLLISDTRNFDYQNVSASHLRLAFGFHDADELEEAVRRMARALTKLNRSPKNELRLVASERPPVARA